MNDLGWHFTLGDKLRDGRSVPAIGEVLRHEGPIEICRSGLHCSERLIDALGYAPGATLHQVRFGVDVLRESDKLVSRERVILRTLPQGQTMPVSAEFAQWCAKEAAKAAAEWAREWVRTRGRAEWEAATRATMAAKTAVRAAEAAEAAQRTAVAVGGQAPCRAPSRSRARDAAHPRRPPASVRTVVGRSLSDRYMRHEAPLWRIHRSLLDNT